MCRLFSNRLNNNVWLKLEISNVKAGLKKMRFFNVYCFFAVNLEYMIKHQL